MRLPRKKEEAFKTINIVGNYKDFNDFYSRNREIILDGVIEIYNEFLTTASRKLKLVVSANLKTPDSQTLTHWDTTFIFNKKDVKVLIEDVMPFYEEIENYEKCAEILNLYNLLTKSKNKTIIVECP